MEIAKITDKALIGVSMILYFLALNFDALGCTTINIETGYGVGSGIDLLLMGWLGLLVMNFGWLANITYVITLVLIARNSNKVFFFACLNVVFALSSLTLYLDKSQHVTLHAGFYLWLASFITLLIDGCIRRSSSDIHLQDHAA